MKELAIQKRIIDAVCAHGGMAFKLSNRFLKGVSDLLIKLPSQPALLAEVKVHVVPRTKGTRIRLDTDITVMQRKFMYDFENVGMACCVISALYEPVKNYQTRSMRIGIFPSVVQEVEIDLYTVVPRGKFEATVINQIEEWMLHLE